MSLFCLRPSISINPRLEAIGVVVYGILFHALGSLIPATPGSSLTLLDRCLSFGFGMSGIMTFDLNSTGFSRL